MKIQLVPPTMRYRESFLRGLREFLHEGLPWWVGGDLEGIEQDFAAFVAKKLADSDDNGVLARWRAIRDTFKPNTVAVWHDDSVLDLCAQWMEAEPGIIWCDHTQFGERLARLTGRKYYGENGLAHDGEFIDADALGCLGLAPGFATGLQVLLETRLTMTKSGGAFTVHEWSPTPEAAVDPIDPGEASS